MPPINVRPARLDDAAAITAVHCSTTSEWRDPHTRQVAPYAALDLFGRWYNGGPWMSVELCAIHLNELLHADPAPLVAEVDGRIVGEAEYHLNVEPPPFGPALHLSVLYVDQDWQRQGVGRALLDVGLELARDLGLSVLTTQPEPEAYAFYRRMQFVPWLAASEMQLAAAGAPPPGLTRLTENPGPPPALALRVGRYQCSALDWEPLWPTLALPGWSDLRRFVWRGALGDGPVVLGLREQLRDPQQADGYAWLPPAAPLKPVVAALAALAAEAGFAAVDLLLPNDALPDLRRAFALDYQTSVEIWRREVATK
jgi:GNAT superfamily N-acetyltransferase